MNSKWKISVGASALIGLGAFAAHAAGFFTPGMPLATGTPSSGFQQTLPLTGNEQIGADTLLASGANPQSEAITTNMLAAFAASQVGGSSNYLIGGDAGTNNFARATTGSSVTTTATYGGPDRWIYWSGTNTAMTVSRDSTAAALPVGTQFDFKMQRTAAQTGVVQMCMAQEISTQNSFSLAGQTVEADFNVFTGANFSATKMTTYIIYGTATDEGTSKLAFGLNGGGGGASAWTGQTNATAAVYNPTGGMLVSTAYHPVAIATIPATATEVAVALCYTPVGTAGTTDALFFSNIQLRKAPALTPFISATVSPDAATTAVPAFDRRLAPIEAILQYSYYYELDESATIFVAGACKAESVTVATCYVQFPVVMRAAPTMTYANGFATETTVAGGTLGPCTTLATASTVASTAPGTNGILVGCTATTVPAAGSAGMLYSNNGTGKIKASAEL